MLNVETTAQPAHEQGITRIITSMSAEEKLTIANGLQKYHSVFKKFWQISSVYFTNEIPTAAVYGKSDTGEVVCMKINPDFWAEQTPTQKLWVICHECLHAILDHFSRGRYLTNKNLANKMMDVVINHTTIEKFGFKRSEIDPNNMYCWLDVFFKPEENVPSGQNFEFYYQLMMNKPQDEQGKGGLVDDHVTMTEEEFKDFIKSMNGQLSDTEKESFKQWLKDQFGVDGEGNGIGDGAGGTLWSFGSMGPIKKKKRWESVIKKWIVRAVGMFEKPKEQWVHENRRMSLLPKSLSLPYTLDQEDILKKKDKIDLFFFLDTSGSCISFGQRFYKAAKTIPTDKFNIHLFNFDTSVYDMDIEKEEVRGGGGTVFHIIEDRIQAWKKEHNLTKYADAVFVISDGEGNEFTAEDATKWHWFLTPGGSTRCLPEGSNVYKLEDYE